MSKKINIIGRQFGRLFVLEEADSYVSPKGAIHLRSLCRCECGSVTIVENQSLLSGRTKSCGCLWDEIVEITRWKHGLAKTRINNIWHHMIKRCTKPKDKSFQRYGARGISVCQRWLNSFTDFVADMGVGKKGWSIERINNDGNYEPANCVWALPTHQARNTRKNKVVTVRGTTACISELVEKFGGNYGTVIWRLANGWTLERAFFEPMQKRKHVIGDRLCEPQERNPAKSQ